MSELHVEIGKRIRMARKQTGMTQQELADIIGLTRTSMANIESGFQKTPLEKLYDIAIALNTGIYELIPEKWGDVDTERVHEIRAITDQIAELQERQIKLRRRVGESVNG